jgi:hypothetical protein
VVLAIHAGPWKARQVEAKATAARMCHSSSRPAISMTAMNSVLSAAPASASTMVRRRSQRSASAPATGVARMPGTTMHSSTMANGVAEPVFW